VFPHDNSSYRHGICAKLTRWATPGFGSLLDQVLLCRDGVVVTCACSDSWSAFQWQTVLHQSSISQSRRMTYIRYPQNIIRIPDFVDRSCGNIDQIDHESYNDPTSNDSDYALQLPLSPLLRPSLPINKIRMFRSEIWLDPRGRGCWIVAGLKDVIGKWNSDYSNKCGDEEGEELSLCCVSNSFFGGFRWDCLYLLIIRVLAAHVLRAVGLETSFKYLRARCIEEFQLARRYEQVKEVCLRSKVGGAKHVVFI